MFSQDLYQNEQAAYTGHFIKNLCDIRDNPNVNFSLWRPKTYQTLYVLIKSIIIVVFLSLCLYLLFMHNSTSSVHFCTE